ncbi:MAG TPA: hypothetical protein VFF06_33260 [Polyangia bacterium]|nr:hypothetical protein [Polyangia bacterium]
MRWLVLLVGLSSAACERRATVAVLESASRSAPPAPRPNVTPPCTLSLTAPDAYQGTAQGVDTCTASSGLGISGDAVLNMNGPVRVIPAWLFEQGPASPLPVHDFHIGVDPAITPGTVVTLAGDNYQPIVFMYWRGATNSCFHFSGTATVVTQRPNLDVTFNLSCADPNSGALPLAGEFKSTL